MWRRRQQEKHITIKTGKTRTTGTATSTSTSTTTSTPKWLPVACHTLVADRWLSKDLSLPVLLDCLVWTITASLLIQILRIKAYSYLWSKDIKRIDSASQKWFLWWFSSHGVVSPSNTQIECCRVQCSLNPRRPSLGTWNPHDQVASRPR